MEAVPPPHPQVEQLCKGENSDSTPLPDVKVKSVNLSEGEVLAIRGEEDGHLVTLANQTLLVEGQVIRSPTNTISVLFRAFPDDLGTFQLHYQGKPAGTAPSPYKILPLPAPLQDFLSKSSSLFANSASCRSWKAQRRTELPYQREMERAKWLKRLSAQVVPSGTEGKA